MADSVQIPVEFTGWDKIKGEFSNATKESKELGETLKKALMGEVLVQGIQRVAGHLKDGIAKEALGAAAAVTQGFFMGGPAGAAIATFTVGVSLLADEFDWTGDRAELAANRIKSAMSQARDIAQSTADKQFSRGMAERLDALDIEIERAKKAREEIEAAEKAWADANKKRGDDTLAYVAEQDEKLQAAQNAAQLEVDKQRAADIEEERDYVVERELVAYDEMRAGRAARHELRRQSARDELAARAVELDQLLALEQQKADARLKREQEAAKQLYDSRMAAQNAVLAMGAQAGNAFANQIGGAVGALAQLDAAQIAAAASSQDLGASLASAALESVQGVLASVAQEATVKAALATAKGIGALATPGAQPLAPGFFGEAAAFAGVAALAGGGAIAAGTAAAAARPAPAPAPTQSGSTSTGSSSRGGSGGGTTIVVNTNRLFSTEAEIGASVEQSRRDFMRYRGF